MKNHKITLSKDQYISDIEPFKSHGIPTNSIVHKSIPGCGITTFFIRYAKHHGIGILPNVPVIESKVAEHNKMFPNNKILGVHKGVDIEDIENYLQSGVEYCKILTTPEGFISKVIEAFDGNTERMYNEFFLLYDECERIITDISYRGAIAAPLNTFFRFKNKALVSATTLPFSDSRFVSFDQYAIEPDWDYSQPLTVINSNNVISSLKRQIDTLNSDNICIFLNSTNGIHAVVNTLGLASQSMVYCAEDSVKKLLTKRHHNATKDFVASDLKRYSFFTSRYFSAFDITLEHQPDVIIVSDLAFANHSMVDPHTEVVQIAGRFRNGVKSLTHITNFNADMEVRSQEEELQYIAGCLDTYEHIVDLCTKETHRGSKDTFQSFLDNSPLAGFFEDGKRNMFMIDNDLYQERVKGYYINKENLKAAYSEVQNHFSATFFDEVFNVGDLDFVKLKRTISKKEQWKEVAKLLDRYTAKPGSFVFLLDDAREAKNYLIRNYPIVAEAHRLLGSSEKLDLIGYSPKALKMATTAAKKAEQIVKISNHVHAVFGEGNCFISEADIKTNLEALYTKNNINFKVGAKHITRYYGSGSRTQQKGQNGYLIGNPIDYETIQNNAYSSIYKGS